jgi:hypothetical protein
VSRVLHEGNSVPGNFLTGDDLPEPDFCPVCGRALTERWSWVTVDGEHEYPQIVCYGGRSPLSVWFGNWLSITEPRAAHYIYDLPVRDVPKVRYFDRRNGRPLSR